MLKVRSKPLVLIIEDEDLLSRMYSQKLKSDGYECIVAPDGEEGIKSALKEQPDIIMCDIMMPKKDGISTLKDLKKSKKTKEIPVIMLTNLSDDKYVEEVLEMGAVSYIVKNQVVPSDVVKKIKEVLDASGKRPLISS